MSSLDGGRIAARGFQYQYLRTLEALLSALDRAEVEQCRIEGPPPGTSTAAVDVVDFDLVNRDGECLLAAQVKSSTPGRRISAPEAFTILATMVTKCNAVAYELITAAVPDSKCRSLSAALKSGQQDPVELMSSLAQLLAQAPTARSLLQTLSADEVERLGRCRIVTDLRDETALRGDLHDQLRKRRTRHQAGLGERSAGLILGYLTSEVLRRAATPQEACWSITDFEHEVLIGDDVLIRAAGHKDWGVVYGTMAPIPDVGRPSLLSEVTAALGPTSNASRGDLKCCVLTGLSGIGKSSTAAAYIAERADQYDLIFWADASTTESLTASFLRLWWHLHRQPADSQDAPDTSFLREKVHELLRALPGRWLLVFDDAFVDTIDAWIPRLGRGDVLITSIDDAGWMRLGRQVSMDRMSTDQACELITRRMALIDEDVEQHRDVLVSLAEALEGWPLAIELACGYLHSCGIPTDRIDRYRHSLLSRALNDRFSVPRGYPRTLVAAVHLSLDRLVQLLAGQQLLSQQVREVLGYLTNFASQRIPIHLAAVSAFIDPEDVPAEPLPTGIDEEYLPLREIFRALVKVSFVRFAEPLAPLSDRHPPGIDDTISMNSVLQQILRQHYEHAPGSTKALSRCAFHTNRWLYIAMEIEHADRSWEIAQHAAAVTEHARRRNVKDNYTALLLGNLAGFKQRQGDLEEAADLLKCELAWLDEIEAPNEVLQIQTRIQLAHVFQRGELPGEVNQIVQLLNPVLTYVQRIREEESNRNAAAVLTAEAAAVLEELRLRHGSNPDVVHLHDAFNALSSTLPSPSKVAEMARARQVGRLINAGQFEAAEHAAREALASYGEIWAGHHVEVQRILIESLATQRRWREAEAEFDRFLSHTGPRSMHRFSEQLLLHNAGMCCALAWTLTDDEAASHLLNRMVGEIDVEALSRQVSPVDRTRYTLLRAVAAAGRGDVPAASELMNQIGSHSLHKETDDETPWQDLRRHFVERLLRSASRSASIAMHDNYQTKADELLGKLPPGWQRDADLIRILERSDVHARLGLSTEPPFDAFGFAAQRLPGPAGGSIALAVVEPKHMLAVGTPAEGPALELQIHRVCSSGFRLVTPEAFSIPTPPGWHLRHHRNRFILVDSTGTVHARAQIKLPQKWRNAAHGNRRVLVLYGFGFELGNLTRSHEAFASTQAFYERFCAAADRGLLAAALVPWKL
ncbi:hypothetical protein [Streptomyces sp. MAI_2237]